MLKLDYIINNAICLWFATTALRMAMDTCPFQLAVISWQFAFTVKLVIEIRV
jgi:hypothetical protein